jgi:hypothetical protein
MFLGVMYAVVLIRPAGWLTTSTHQITVVVNQPLLIMQVSLSSCTASRVAVRPNVTRQMRAAPVRAMPMNVLIDIAERTGTVDAPIEYAIGA